MNPSETISDILTRTEQNQIKFIDLQFTDVVGVVKNVTIPVHQLPAALENGIWETNQSSFLPTKGSIATSASLIRMTCGKKSWEEPSLYARCCAMTR